MRSLSAPVGRRAGIQPAPANKRKVGRKYLEWPLVAVSALFSLRRCLAARCTTEELVELQREGELGAK